MPLLQWTRSAEDLAMRDVELRLVDGTDLGTAVVKLTERGLQNIQSTGASTFKGTISARDLIQISDLRGICAIVDATASKSNT